MKALYRKKLIHKDKCHTSIYRLAVSFLMLSSVCHANALEKISDAELSNTTAQDGITIVYKGEGEIGIDKIRLLQNGNDFSTLLNKPNHNKTSGFELDTSAGKIRFCSDNTASATCNLNQDGTVITIDTDGGGTGNNPFINANIKMHSKSIFVPVTTVNLIGSTDVQSDRNTTWNKVALVKFNDGIKINSKTALEANIQLGSQAQGHMILLSPPSDTFGTDIDLGNITVFSQKGNGTTDSQITTNVAVNGISGQLTNDNQTTATGTAIDVDGTKGIVITKDVATVKSININNTVLGKDSVSDANIFNGLQNASIGDISIENIAINGLEVSVRGM